MLIKRLFKCLLLLLFGALTACGGNSGSDTDNATAVPAGPTPIPTFDPAARMTDTRTANVGVEADDAVLAWIAEGVAPGSQTADKPGQIVLLNAGGDARVVLDLPNGTTRVQACGERATSPDSRYFAFFVGSDSNGTLYLMDGRGVPAAVAEMNPVGCLGNGTFQYAPDGTRLGYIDFAADALTSEFPSGTLKIHNTGDRAEASNFDNAATFDMVGGNVAFISFFNNNQGQATEAAIYLWASGEPDEIATLYADENCRFTSAGIAFTGADSLATLMGQRCAGQGTKWQLHTVDIAARRETLALSGTAGGGFASNSRTNTLFPATEGSSVFYTVPDGLQLNTVSIRTTPVENPAEGADLLTYLNMPRSSINIYGLTNNAFPHLSPDERWLALVNTTPNGDSSFNVLDLNASDLPPITLPAGNRGDTISAIDFTGDSAQAVFIAGGNNKADNSLFSLDLATATDNRVIRGRYSQVVAAPDGESAAVTEWLSADAGTQRDYLNISIIGLATGESAPLFTGAIIAEGRATDHRFAYLLAWRKG